MSPHYLVKLKGCFFVEIPMLKATKLSILKNKYTFNRHFVAAADDKVYKHFHMREVKQSFVKEIDRCQQCNS